FNFYEPIAAELGTMFGDSFLAGYEDALCMLGLFAGSLGLLRLATNALANTEIDYPPVVQQVGSVLVAMVAGYLVAGFLVGLLRTLPWQDNFLGFTPRSDSQGGARRVLPPDRVWLSMMHFAGKGGRLGWGDGPTFDPDGSFELRYARLRRYKDKS